MIARPRISPIVIALAVALALVPAALAGKGGGGKPGGGGSSGGSGCTASPSTVTIDNDWTWSGWGSYGLPGQQLKYAVHVTNNSCSSATYTINLTAPTGFTISAPTSSISLGAKAQGYVFVNVTSPSTATDGDYPLSATLSQSGSTISSFTSYYKVYSSDSTAPTLFWPAPGDGAAITGRSYNVGIDATDDHLVKTIDIYIDGALMQSLACTGISYDCTAVYTWSPRTGQHTATFKASDWMGNVSTQTVRFTVS